MNGMLNIMKPLKNEPWLTKGAIKFLDDNLNFEDSLLEIGSGGSTLYFSQKVKKIVSIEFNEIWYKRIFDALIDNKIKNVTLILLKTNSKNISKVYNTYLKGLNEKFNWIISDGVDGTRGAPIILANKLLYDNGWIILDNYNRSKYKKCLSYLKEWKEIIFNAESGRKYSGSGTAFYKKPKSPNLFNDYREG